jgi:hypothetical protein
MVLYEMLGSANSDIVCNVRGDSVNLLSRAASFVFQMSASHRQADTESIICGSTVDTHSVEAYSGTVPAAART